MTISRKIILRDAPPLVGTEIAVYVDGVATDLTDGYTFGIFRISLSPDSDKFVVEWGDGSYELHNTAVNGLTHVYLRPGLYRVRLSDGIGGVWVSSSNVTVSSEVYAPMVRELRTNSTKITVLPRTAFNNAFNLRRVDFDDSAIRGIAGGAFDNCRMLASVKGLEKVERIYQSAFRGCISLPERIDLPNLINITGGASLSPFLGTNIKEFHFGAENEAAIKALAVYEETGGNLGVEGAACYFDL